MTHVEGLVAFGRLRQRHILKLVGTVGAVSLLRTSLQHLIHINYLSTCTDRQES